jgi:uncharacterized membrane protein YedE/YeeE
MTDPARVIAFLDITGNWDPTLAFVMGGGLLVTLPVFQLGLGALNKPLFDTEFHLPNRTSLDFKLISGATLFGIGWGLVGLCPGPAIGSLAYLNIDILYFVAAMCAGMFVSGRIEEMMQPEQVVTETSD